MADVLLERLSECVLLIRINVTEQQNAPN